MSLSDEIKTAIRSVTKEFKMEKRKADRADRISASRLMQLRYKPARISIRDVAFAVMEDAYNKASSNGRYYANARQIMYAARPAILEATGLKELSSAYFTQTVLKDYLEERTPDWRVVWDARGHLIEPYTNTQINLGGSAVKQYISGWHAAVNPDLPSIQRMIDTKGPANRFNNALFIEKEGFTEILVDAGFKERYSMALMSTKGIPVKAACDLIDALDQKGVRVFVLHDFDLAGFKVLRTLREGTRLSVGSDVIDLGLRMADIEGLPSEPVAYKQKANPKVYLRYECGATEEEAEFLVSKSTWSGYLGQRVELNAMTSEQLITWLDQKLAEHGVTRLIPDEDTIRHAYKRAVFLKRLQDRIDELAEEIEDDAVDLPDDLIQQVKDRQADNPRTSWDKVVWEIAEEV